MNIAHLFKNVFNSDGSKIYRAGAEKPKASEKAERQKLSAEEMRREVEAAGKRMLETAKAVIKEVEDLQRTLGISKKAKGGLARVKGNVELLEKALKSRKLTAKGLEEWGAALKHNIEEGIEGGLKGTKGDPFSVDGGLSSYVKSHFDVKIKAPETVAKAQSDVLRVVRHLSRYAPSNSAYLEKSFGDQYDRELGELAAARQLLRKRGKLPREKDSNLRLAREVTDIVRLTRLARKGQYVQEKPDALAKQEARLTERLLRTTGALSLKPGGVVDTGLVMIQRSHKGEAYLISVAEGAMVNGNPQTIPVSTVVDMGFQKRLKEMERKIATARQTVKTTGGQFLKTAAEQDLAKLEKQYENMEELGPEAFNKKAWENTSKVSKKMFEQLNKTA